MKFTLECAKSGRSTCALCGLPIAKGEVRLVEPTYGERLGEPMGKAYSHFTCSFAQRRERALDAIAIGATPDDVAAAALELVARVDASCAADVRERRTRRAQVAVAGLEDDDQTRILLAQLEVEPHDRGLYAVLADHLLLRGDPRGELITLDLAGSLEPAALVRRRELTTALTPSLGPLARVTWGIGFLRKVEAALEVLAHPSCRLVESVSIHGRVLIPRDRIPKSVRRIEIRGGLDAGSDLSALPHLEHVTIDDFVELAHPTLRCLELSVSSPETLAAVTAAHLPGLRRLEIERYRHGRIVMALAPGGCLPRLDELHIRAALDASDVDLLSRALDGRKLRLIALARTGLSRDVQPRLKALCEELQFTNPLPASSGLLVEHANKPEWGRGRLVREADGKIEIEFPGVGKKVFKADAPFLKRV